MKLFSKQIQPKCEYCRHAQYFSGCEIVGCKHCGVMSLEGSCRHFVYDPLKRVPDPPAVFTPKNYNKNDFEL